MASAAHSADYSISCGQPVAEPGTVFQYPEKIQLDHHHRKQLRMWLFCRSGLRRHLAIQFPMAKSFLQNPTKEFYHTI